MTVDWWQVLLRILSGLSGVWLVTWRFPRRVRFKLAVLLAYVVLPVDLVPG